MKGLIIKDVFNLKKSIGTTIFMILFYTIFSYNTGNMSMLIGMTTIIMTTMSITSMSYDDMAKWDSYALAMPITRRDIVLSKYILSLVLSASATIISSIFALAITYLREDTFGIEKIQEILVIAYIVFVISVVYVSIVFPLIFRFGVENARILMLGSYLIPAGMVYLLYKMEVQLPSEEQLRIILYASPIILILILILSASTTFGIYKKKDI